MKFFKKKKIALTEEQQKAIDAQLMSPELLIKRRIVALQNQTLDVNIFKILRTKILKALKQNNWNSFGITSPTENAGVCMVSVNLALVMAMEFNQSIMLIDMNLRAPKIHTFFDFDVKKGLKDCIEPNPPLLSELLLMPNIDRLAILPGHGETLRSSEMISSPQMQTLIKNAKNHYQPQITIFNLPPVLNSDDVLTSLDYYDAMLLVVEEGGNKKDEVRDSLKMLAGIELLGTVLNKSQTPSDYGNYH
ncbi:MAG: CpsD/CapB family tyrosine-protein kinase [Methylococcales bacterium]|nr:CpsD/CapB family tyrosine-protein kinase [Methylococcales bacterium]